MTNAPRWNLWTGIELDPIPAQIAYYLNPSTTIYNQGFEKMSLPDGYFDMELGNVPFGSYSVFEPRYDGLLIHNHFISKSIDLVREGGLIALITSTGTLDSEGNKEFRRSHNLESTFGNFGKAPISIYPSSRQYVRRINSKKEG